MYFEIELIFINIFTLDSIYNDVRWTYKCLEPILPRPDTAFFLKDRDGNLEFTPKFILADGMNVKGWGIDSYIGNYRKCSAIGIKVSEDIIQWIKELDSKYGDSGEKLFCFALIRSLK